MDNGNFPSECLNDSGLVARIKEKTGLDLSTSTPATWRHRGQGPRHFTVNGSVRYFTTDIDAWLAAQGVEPTPIAASGATSDGGLTGAVHP